MKTRSTDSRTDHDHSRCIARALQAAEQVCDRRGIQLTPIRRRVLELIWRRHTPFGAYELLGALKKGDGALAPPTIYRALDFLLSAGLVHRIAALNAFIGCATPEDAHTGQFLVCTSCNRVEELDDADIAKLLRRKAKSVGFAADGHHVEIQGTCAECTTRH